MASPYDNQTHAESYIQFLDSNNGKIQKEILGGLLRKRLDALHARTVLEVGAGTGWLVDELMKAGFQAQGVEPSDVLLGYGKKQYPSAHLELGDATSLKFVDGTFDCVIANMVFQDVNELKKALAECYRVTKLGGHLLATLPNPAFAFPAGVWKRGIIGRLLGRKPRLILNNKKYEADSARPHSNFPRPLSLYVDAAAEVGFNLRDKKELRSETDSSNFDLRYQLYRFPVILLLEFEKPRQ